MTRYILGNQLRSLCYAYYHLPLQWNKDVFYCYFISRTSNGEPYAEFTKGIFFKGCNFLVVGHFNILITG